MTEKHETKQDASHTSGKWELSGDGIWAVSPWNARVRIATVTIHSPMNGIDWQANARLIAAAPKLLEAAMKFDKALSENYADAQLCQTEREELTAAIAEATGEGSMTYLGIEIVNIPSGMGGVLPAAMAARHNDGTAQVICLHEEYLPNWLLTVKQEDVTPCTYKLTDFAKRIIKERKAV